MSPIGIADSEAHPPNVRLGPTSHSTRVGDPTPQNKPYGRNQIP
jgi:hypothetical protein